MKRVWQLHYSQIKLQQHCAADRFSLTARHVLAQNNVHRLHCPSCHEEIQNARIFYRFSLAYLSCSQVRCLYLGSWNVEWILECSNRYTRSWTVMECSGTEKRASQLLVWVEPESICNFSSNHYLPWWPLRRTICHRRYLHQECGNLHF